MFDVLYSTEIIDSTQSIDIAVGIRNEEDLLCG